MARVVFDLGHHGLTGGRPGATYGDRREVAIVRRYTTEAADQLEAAGVDIDLAGQGRYSARQDQAGRDGAPRAGVGIGVDVHFGASFDGCVPPPAWFPAGVQVGSLVGCWGGESVLVGVMLYPGVSK